MVEPDSGVPMVGASGAISGVMGAYLVLYPRVRVFTFVPLGFFFTNVALPAWAMLIYWMVLQLAGGVTGIFSEASGGVAFWAHIGGFLAGVVLIKLFVRANHLAEHQAHHWRPKPRRLVAGRLDDAINIQAPQRRTLAARGATRSGRATAAAASTARRGGR